jgi:hypothetical protein
MRAILAKAVLMMLRAFAWARPVTRGAFFKQKRMRSRVSAEAARVIQPGGAGAWAVRLAQIGDGVWWRAA